MYLDDISFSPLASKMPPNISVILIPLYECFLLSKTIKKSRAILEAGSTLVFFFFFFYFGAGGGWNLCYSHINTAPIVIQLHLI